MAAAVLAIVPFASLALRAQPPGCDLGGYRSQAGLTAANGAEGLDVVWDGGGDRDVRLRLAIDRGTPTMRELAIRKRGAEWGTLAADARPEFRIVSGLRRMSNQQMQPLRELGVELTPAIVSEKKWDAFWDAPLDLNPQVGRGGNPPPAAGVAGLDDMSNWLAGQTLPPKYLLSISEVRYQSPGDDIYASSPVSYVKLASVPPASDPSPVIRALRSGEYFVTSGEVLIASYAVHRDGARSAIDAEIEYTFPLELVEVVWGDGVTTGRQIVPATDLAPSGRHRFRIPFERPEKNGCASWRGASRATARWPSRSMP